MPDKINDFLSDMGLKEIDIDDSLYTKSVQAGNLEKVTSDDYRIILPMWYNTTGNAIGLNLPIQLPPFWSINRDIVLRSTVTAEALWSASLMIAITKMAAKAWQITSQSQRKSMYYQKMMINADGMNVGWVGFVSKHLQDYLMTDNGSFIEVVREKKGVGSKIIGIRHLDSLRCVRTRDPKYPVVYKDLEGEYHRLRDYQVITMSDMVDPSAEHNGIGHCAASRAYQQIYKMASIERYISEKVSGMRPLSIYFLSGVLKRQVTGAMDEARGEQIANGIAQYMGALIVPVSSDTVPGLVEVPLASLPDRFDRKQEFDIAILNYADNLGLDPQDLQPLTGTSLGTGAQSQVLDQKARGKGLAAWSQQFAHMMNTYVYDDKSQFAFSEEDIRDKDVKARVSQTLATVSGMRIKAGITTSQQELQIMVDSGELPGVFLEEDQTPESVLSDNDKPVDESNTYVEQSSTDNYQDNIEPEQIVLKKESKANIKDLITANLDEAIKIFEDVNKNV